MDDGMFRLQTIRYESIELTEQILTDKLHKGGRPPAEKTRDKEQAEKPAADWSYNLEMLGEVALKVPKAARKDSIQRKDFIPIQFGSTEDNVMKVEDNNNNEDEEESYEDASLDEESNSPPEEMDTSEYSEPGPSSSWKISSPEPPSALQNLAFRGFYNENSSSLSSIDSFSSAGVGSTCDETSKENFQPVSEENGDFKEIQVEIVTGSGSVAVVSGMPSSLIIDPTTGMVEYPATENWGVICDNMACLSPWWPLLGLPSWSSILTLNMREPSYLGLTRSISWLLMLWLLTSPGHQHPWYWLYGICRPFSYLRKDFKYLSNVKSMWRNDIKCKYMLIFPLKNLARKGLKSIHWNLFEDQVPIDEIYGCLMYKSMG